MFSQSYRLFWSSNVANLQVNWNRSYLEHPLAEKMRLGHAYVGIKLMYDRILNAVVTLITSCPFELQTWNPCLIYVNRDNPVLFVIECNVIAVKKRIEGQVCEVSMRTTSLDEECLPSLWAKLHPLLEFAHSLSLLKYRASLKFTWLLTYIKPNENLLPLVIDSLLVKLFPRWKPSYYNTK